MKAHFDTRKAARLWQEFFFARTDVFMKVGWDAVAVEPYVYHKAGSLGDDDDACVCAREATLWWSRGSMCSKTWAQCRRSTKKTLT